MFNDEGERFIDLTQIKDKEALKKAFSNPHLGMIAAQSIATMYGILGVLERRFDGSNIVFKCGQSWIKLSPPFWRDAFTAEVTVVEHWQKKLPCNIPVRRAVGEYAGWDYLICSNVPGISFEEAKLKMKQSHLEAFADDIGHLISVINSLTPIPLTRAFGSWHDYAAAQIADAEAVHLARGCSKEWARKIAQYLEEHKSILDSLKSSVTIHGDINYEHALVDQNTFRLSGLIDFADAMNAPIEVEFVLPFRSCFRGNQHLQERVLAAFGKPIAFSKEDRATGMMVLTLLNRFIAFESWFHKELTQDGLTSLEAIAKASY